MGGVCAVFIDCYGSDTADFSVGETASLSLTERPIEWSPTLPIEREDVFEKTAEKTAVEQVIVDEYAIRNLFNHIRISHTTALEQFRSNHSRWCFSATIEKQDIIRLLRHYPLAFPSLAMNMETEVFATDVSVVRAVIASCLFNYACLAKKFVTWLLSYTSKELRNFYMKLDLFRIQNNQNNQNNQKTIDSIESEISVLECRELLSITTASRKSRSLNSDTYRETE